MSTTKRGTSPQSPLINPALPINPHKGPTTPTSLPARNSNSRQANYHNPVPPNHALPFRPAPPSLPFLLYHPRFTLPLKPQRPLVTKSPTVRTPSQDVVEWPQDVTGSSIGSFRPPGAIDWLSPAQTHDTSLDDRCIPYKDQYRAFLEDTRISPWTKQSSLGQPFTPGYSSKSQRKRLFLPILSPFSTNLVPSAVEAATEENTETSLKWAFCAALFPGCFL